MLRYKNIFNNYAKAKEIVFQNKIMDWRRDWEKMLKEEQSKIKLEKLRTKAA